MSDKLYIFGSNHSAVGDSSSDLLLRTKGKVRIQWGSKFIDLIKDGKINTNSNFIFTVLSVDLIDGKNGLYVVNNESVYLKIGDVRLPLSVDSGNIFVSFLEELETTSELKYTALQNIGFIYEDIESITDQSLKNGMIYVESEQLIYLVKDGVLSKFTAEIPNPFTEQLIIAKSDTNKGAIVIKGQGSNNSIAFELLFIYNENNESYIDSNGSIHFRVGSSDKVIIDNNKTTFKNLVISSTILSPNYTETSGFKLYEINSESYLDVDNLTVRNSVDSINNVYETEWLTENNIIKNIEIAEDPENADRQGFQIDLVYENKYYVGDCLCTYATVKVETEDETKYYQLKLQCVVEISSTEGSNNIIFVTLDESFLDSFNLSINEVLNNLKGLPIFLVGSENNSKPIIRKSSSGIDIIKATNFEEESDINSIKTRVGDLNELKDSVLELSDEDITGIYSEKAYFKEAKYTDSYELPENDDSNKLASTEWVLNIIRNALPIGSIIAYHGDTIPDGWEMCTGSNGTPNLLGKFIMADITEGERDLIEVRSVEILEGYGLTSVHIYPTYYTLVFIMKVR